MESLLAVQAYNTVNKCKETNINVYYIIYIDIASGGQQ